MNPDALSPFPSNRLSNPVSPLQDAPMYAIQDIIQSMRSMQTTGVQELKKEMEQMKKRTDELNQHVKGR